MTPNAYSFFPWLRTGLTTRLTDDPGTAARASMAVKLRLTGDALKGGTITRDVDRRVQLYGPGDIVGVDARAISRVEPSPWITNAEPNYLAHVEFYDEDFPWRYSPAPATATTPRLAPWLALIVLAGGQNPAEDPGAEFAEGTVPGRPLPYITVRNPAATLPPPEQLGAFAHVHVNGALNGQVVSNDMGFALPALGGILASNADSACSRVMCPRHLRPNTTYHAFLVPAFETGRLAGLGLDPAPSPKALHGAWGPDYTGRQEPGALPYYHRWFFGTGAAGDFEFLVRLLVPRLPDARVGRRDVDVHRSAGPGLPGIDSPAALGGVLRLGGALRAPLRADDLHENWDDQPPDKPYPHDFQRALAKLINLGDDYLEQPPIAAHARLAAELPTAGDLAAEPDPVITPPLYGRWHALTTRLLFDRENQPITQNRNWVHRLNLDPRFRIAAGLGTRVVRERQEEFMLAAWSQVGDVLAANARIRAAQLAREVGFVLHGKHLEPPATLMRARVAAMMGAEGPPPSGAGLAAALSGRTLALTAPAGSRVLADDPRAAGLGMETASNGAGKVSVGFHVARSRVSGTPLSPPMRRLTRPGSRLMRTLPFTETLAPDALVPRMDEPGGVTAAPPKVTPEAVVTPGRLDEVLHSEPPAEGGDPVDRLPKSPDFVITLPGDPFIPTEGTDDSDEALRFKDALRDLYRGWDAAELAGQAEPRPRLDVTAFTDSMLTGLRADQAVPRSLLTSVALPDRLRPFAERFIEAMAYPVIDLPMYQALLDMSVDLFVPNLSLIPPNTITLLEPNPEFIESYLVGLNHEMARELLWREYPTDQRGSPFRQFWDVRTVPSPPAESAKERRERLYDIRPVHDWPKTGRLGENDNRDIGQAQENELVLVIRGELLRKYPNAAVYAHRARWQPDNEHPDPRQERLPVDLLDPLNPTPKEILFPLYEARVAPDIHLLGFDVTAKAAKGEHGDPGWFFVIKERPGDPRFGLDEGPKTRVEVWNDLSWADVDPAGNGFIRLDDTTTPVPLLKFDLPDDDQEKLAQQGEDLELPVWNGGLSSADVAYVLFQAPVLLAVHAQEMLP
ncbi:hypothetical protein SAMN05444920_101726 [Nonomuraea solani]|uniref:Uncharacterized protein n=1 Tax=Nonomuraea solani TaxID=1144553 RepID=A0A1H5V0U4_9ACTN|nr:hypothetical protein [Nonomuraea solani]SEF80985.1 hypothetical protein SAMN05444920_101726 [Nonomuraea solani]